MLPRFSNSKTTKVSTSDSHKRRQSTLLSVLKKLVNASYQQDAVHCDLCVMNSFSSLSLKKLKSAMSYTVLVICLCCSCVEMLRVTTSWIAALMTDVSTAWNGPVSQQIRNAMSRLRTGRTEVPARDHWIMSAKLSMPYPALSWVFCFENARPETFIKGLFGILPLTFNKISELIGISINPVSFRHTVVCINRT